MVNVQFTMVTDNGKSALHDGYHTIGTLHFTMVTNKGNCTLHNG